MKAQLISDIHSEFYSGSSKLRLFSKIQFGDDLDFILLPGDIVVPGFQSDTEMRMVLDFLSKHAKHVLYVLGNHEFYHSHNRTEVISRIRNVLPKNFHLLENNDLTLDGIHFYGGTMWFPFYPLNQLYESEMNDFNSIGEFREWVYQENTSFRENGKKCIASNTIVLSHHLPLKECTPVEFRNDSCNRFFVSDEHILIENVNPKLWVYGHTHFSNDLALEGTRVACNPFGYPYERENKPYPVIEFEI